MFFPVTEVLALKSLEVVLTYLLVWCFLFPTLFRYIDNETGRVMHDIVTKDSYGRQFEAIQHCFRIIGFTDEVRDPAAKPLLILFIKINSSAACAQAAIWFCGHTPVPQNLSYDSSELWKQIHTLRSQDQPEVSVDAQASLFRILYHTVFCVNGSLLQFVELGLRASYNF